MTGVDTPSTELSPSPQHPPPRATSLRRIAARVFLSFALVAPFVTVPFALRIAVERLAQRTGTSLALAADAITAETIPFEDPSTPLNIGDPADVLLPYPALFSSSEQQPSPNATRRRDAAARARVRHGGIRIRADVVARAASSGMRPSGAPVAASGLRPAGVVLQGVSGFGAGLRDGDVVTSIEGAPARSVSTVVGAVIGALRAKAKVITAVVWRGDQQLSVAVEIPWGKVRPRSQHD